jgi:type II secretory pathway pseudopilin PulG
MSMPFTSRIERPRGESGLTIIEVIVAALVLALGAMATFGVLASATKNTQRAKATQVALDRAQQEIETMRSLSNKALALTTTPEHFASPLDPNYRVSGNEFATVRTPEGGKAVMVVEGGSLYGGGFVSGATVTPGPVSFTSGDVSGKIYRYVVWRDDANCPAATCPGPQDYKQIVVAVKLDTPGNQSGERGYVELTSDFIDPTDSALNDPIPGASGVVTAQQLFLSDTPCAASGSTVRQSITGDHLLHNTLGTCASGLQTGSEKEGAPDALLLGSPPDPDPVDASNPPLYDYSNDVYLEPTPNTDKGVQIRPDDSSDCNSPPTGKASPESQIHRWVTDPMPATLSEGFKITGNVTLEFYSQTLNGANHTATLCVFLFKRHETGSPPKATDTLMTNKSTGLAYWKFSPSGTGFWWKNEWHRERFTMTIGGSTPVEIPVGDRLGVALSFDRATTQADAVQIMYDHPTYPTRIEVETNTPLDGG